MLTIIGIFPATYALNPEGRTSLADVASIMEQARPLIESYGDDRKSVALAAIQSLDSRARTVPPAPDNALTAPKPKLEIGPGSANAQTRSSVRDDIYQVISQLKHAQEAKGVTRGGEEGISNIVARNWGGSWSTRRFGSGS